MIGTRERRTERLKKSKMESKKREKENSRELLGSLGWVSLGFKRYYLRVFTFSSCCPGSNVIILIDLS
jgi:hypothetical protein